MAKVKEDTKSEAVKFDEADIKVVIEKCTNKHIGMTLTEIAVSLVDLSHQVGKRSFDGRSLPVYEKKYLPAFDGASAGSSMSRYRSMRIAWEERRKTLIMSACESIKQWLVNNFGNIVRDKSERPSTFERGGYVFRYIENQLEPGLWRAPEKSEAMGF